MNKFELEERLINFAVLIIELANELPNTKAGNHLSGQLVRYGTSHALNLMIKKVRMNFLQVNPPTIF